MCRIVGAIAPHKILHIIVEGLNCLEYCGYDAAGIEVLDAQEEKIARVRAKGKVSSFEQVLVLSPDIAHTLWVTHGVPCIENAHPHLSGNQVAVVHNGIIENYAALKSALQ